MKMNMSTGYEIRNAVLCGGNGELFLGAGAHKILKFATGERTVPLTASGISGGI